jgi:hypothetical protein
LIFWCYDVSRLAKLSLKVVSTVLVAGFASCVGFILTEVLYVRWFVPGLVKESPHDGQIGLAVWVTALYGASVCGVVVLCFGIFWTIRTSKHSTS